MYVEQESHLIVHLCIKYELEQIFSYKTLFTPSKILILIHRNTIQRFRHFTDYLSWKFSL